MTTTIRVKVKPEVLRWARVRAGWDLGDETTRRFPRLSKWEDGSIDPTFRQLEHFAKATHVPIGFFFLDEPPDEELPIPDLRTVANGALGRPSADLLDTIYICQERQEWYHNFLRSQREERSPFVGSLNLDSNVEHTATLMRNALGFNVDERRRMTTWTEALRRFIEQADALGVLVMVSGVVGNNNKRKLNPEEFRGFALSDDIAPLVFINGADTKAAQMFTLAHELAHIWLGHSALSDVNLPQVSTNAIERWCNAVSAELLVPMSILCDLLNRDDRLTLSFDYLARHFKVSTLVILRRLLDANALTPAQFSTEYKTELDRLRAIPTRGGGDFYLTESARVGKRFARALIGSTIEGQTLYREAFHLLGFSKTSTFNELAETLGVS